MRNNIKLLDCTLRDGGYINDWEFGHSNIINVFERIAESDVDIIEVGFIDDRRPYDYNRSIFPDTASIRRIFGMAARRAPMVVGMIDYGTCDISRIEPCEDSYIDGIRVIFKKHRMHEAMAYCKRLKELGYEVFSQLVSTTSYNDQELIELIGLVNEVKPRAVSIVDTYSLYNPSLLLHHYDILEKNVLPEISIGFHAHNNMQLAYANVLTFLEKTMEYDSKREIIVDGTLFGMGKNSGNAPIELVANYLNKLDCIDKIYNISPMLEAIEESIKDIYIKYPWGYKTHFYLSSKNEIHPSYISYFQNKGNLSVSKMDAILQGFADDDRKLLYDKEYAEEVYQRFIDNYLNDSENGLRLAKELSGKNILLIGPGKNIFLQEDKVSSFIDDIKPVIISVNYIPKHIKTNYVFVTKVSRYQKMIEQLHQEENSDIRIICTTNVECDKAITAYMFNREPLLEKREEICDNSLLMLLKVLRRANILSVYLAGFDGYSDKEENYFEPGMEYSFIKSSATRLNHQIREKLFNDYSDLKLNFVTYSHYLLEEDPNSASF